MDYWLNVIHYLQKVTQTYLACRFITANRNMADQISTTNAASPPLLEKSESGVTLIVPKRNWRRLLWQELWEHRELLYFLTWRDLKVRYKQTMLGVAWAIIQPLVTMLIFTLFFGRLAKIPSDNFPYPVFSFVALVPWSFFANSLTKTSISVVENAQLIRKIYFPRLLIPLATLLSGLVDFTLAFIVLIGMMLAYGIVPTAAVFLLPLFLLLAFITALGAGLWLSAMNAQFRDVNFIVPFMVQLWLFMTPVVYPSSMLPRPWQIIYGINPMAGVVEGFRWALLGSAATPASMYIVSTTVAVILLISGFYYFHKIERSFADLV
jgi:lipopolysaccharide transport system permease protein